MTMLPNIHTLLSTRIFPEPRCSIPTKIPLSITDSAAAALPSAQCIWYYDAGTNPSLLSTDCLMLSLKRTLSAYPQFTGQLEWIPFKEGGQYTERFGRIQISFGDAGDCGLNLVIAHCKGSIDHIVPDFARRGRCFDAERVPAGSFSAENLPLALCGGPETIGLPGMIVKLTRFDCGGLAIAIRVVHALVDARSFMHFMHDWAAVNRAIAQGLPLPQLSRTFEPSLLDRAAAGDINANRPDPKLLEVSRTLPFHRFDWWASADGCPEPSAPWTRIPPALAKVDMSPPGISIPWSDWDFSAPVSRYRLQFNADALSRIYQEATKTQSSVRISHLDALLSHLWSLVNRARGLHSDEHPVFFNYILGLKSRLSPTLSESFIGCPIIFVPSSSTGREATTEDSLGTLSAAIRSSTNRINPSTLPALLHEMAHQIGAYRTRQYFSGQYHLSATSWLHLNIQDLDFGAGVRPRYVDPLLAVVDGFLVLVEANEDSEAVDTDKTGAGTKRWFDGAVDVVLHLESRAMRKLLEDPLLYDPRRGTGNESKENDKAQRKEPSPLASRL